MALNINWRFQQPIELKLRSPRNLDFNDALVNLRDNLRMRHDDKLDEELAKMMEEANGLSSDEVFEKTKKEKLAELDNKEAQLKAQLSTLKAELEKAENIPYSKYVEDTGTVEEVI